MHRHVSERSQIPNINTALANTNYVPTPAATPNSPVSLSRFPSTTSTLATTTTATTATSWNSGKSSSGSSNPGAVRVVTLLNALGPALGPGSPQAQFQGRSPQASPSYSPSVRFQQTQEVEVSPPMAVPVAPQKKTHFLDRFSGSPSLGSGTSSSSSQPEKAVRMVGRGGSGSKLRSVKSVPSVPDVTGMKSDTSSSTSSKNGKVRYVGRGGQGSRHKRAKEEGEDEHDGPSVGLKLPWKKVKKSQSKRTLNSETESSMNPEDYDYYLRPQRSNSSRGTFTTSNTPSSLSGSHDFAGVSVSSLENFGLEPYGISATTRRNPMSNSKSTDASLNKLAKQMGELPPHLIYQQLLHKRHGSSSLPPLPGPRLDTRNLDHRHTPSTSTPSIFVSEEPTPTSTQHRVLDPLPSFGSASAYSLTSSLETSASCELHRFALADDMSDTWGKVRDGGEGRHCYSDNSGLEDDYEAPSPITFSPPTPVDRKQGPARCNVCHIETGMEPDQDALSEFSVAVSDTNSGFGYTVNEAGDEIEDAMTPPPAEVWNSRTSSTACHGPHAHAVSGAAVQPSQSFPALGQPETHTHTYSRSHLGSPSTQSARAFEAGWRSPEPEYEDDMKTPVVERGYGADSFGRLVEEKIKAHSPSSSETSLCSEEALLGHSTSTSSTPEPLPPLPSKGDITFDFESRYLPPLPSPAPSTTSFASSISSASSLPYASTLSSEPSRSRPETPFGNLTRLLVPTPSKRPGTSGSTSSTASTSTANSHLAVASKRHLGQARRLSISADSFEEDVIVLVGSVQSRRRRSVNWGPGSAGMGALGTPAQEEAATAFASVEEKAKKERKSGKKSKEPEAWTGEWNTEMDDVIKALRAL